MDAAKRVIQVFSNTNFSVNYDDSSLHPQVELILLTQQIKYDVDAKGKIKKGWKVEEARFLLAPENIDQLIGQLKLLRVGVDRYKDLSTSINTLVAAAAEEQKKEKAEDTKE